MDLRPVAPSAARVGLARTRDRIVWPAAFGLALLLAGPAGAQALPGAVVLPPDEPVQVNGVEVACTGIGQTREEARWRAFNVRIEFSNARNEYLGEGAVRVSDRSGAPLIEARCDGPWILMKLPPGTYRVEGQVPETQAALSARFQAPESGQARIVLQFVDVEG